MKIFGKSYKKIYLVRHGDKIKEKGDVGLSDLGFKQARLTAEYLKKFKIDFILSSPLKRAIQTAEVISNILGLNFKHDYRLRERLSYGEIPNQSYKEYVKLCRISSFNRNFKLPNGETSISSGERIKKVINKLIIKSFFNILLISHGGIITDYLRNTFSNNILNEFNPDFLNRLEVRSCSITILEFRSKKPSLLTLDYIKHLNKINK